MMDPSNQGNYQYHQQQELLQLLAGSSLSASVPTPPSFTTAEGSSHDWNPYLLLATDRFVNGSNTREEKKALPTETKHRSSNNENSSRSSSMNSFIANPADGMRLMWPLHAENYYARLKDESLQDSFIQLITGADGCGGTTGAEALTAGCSSTRSGGSYYSLVHPTTTLDPISSSSSSGASTGFPSIAEFQSALESAKVRAGESILVGEDQRDFEHHQAALPCPDQQPMASTQIKMSSPDCSVGDGICQGKKRSTDDPTEVDSKATRLPQKKPRQEPRSSSAPFKVRKEKLGDRIAALQQLVAPFGKTDTASVLMEAIGYIKFLQDQVETLSVPYLRSSKMDTNVKSTRISSDEGGERRLDLRSRGLCLVPLSCTSYITNENVGIWLPDFSGGT